MKRFLKATLATGLVAGLSGAASAALLSDVSTTAMHTGAETVGISFTPGSEGFTDDGTTSDSPINVQSFIGAVYAYGIYGASYFDASLGGNTGGGLAVSGGAPIIGVLDDAGASNTYADIWTTNATTAAPNETGLGSRARSGGVTNATIDISGLSSGSLWVFHGRWQGGTTDYLDLVMSGAGQTDVVLNNAGATAAGTIGTLHWATRIDFTDAGDYDSITFNHFANSGSAAGYIIGAVVTDVTESTVIPEPASLALLGLGGLMLVRRRRG